MDTATLTSSSIVLHLSSATLASTVAWTDDFRVLEIMPYQGDWGLGTYSLSLNGLFDVEGNLISSAFGSGVSLSASLAADATPVATLKGLRVRSSLYLPVLGRTVDTSVIDYYTSSYRLVWDKAEGATHYEIYSREGTDSAWRLAYAPVSDTQVAVTVATFATLKALARHHMVVPRGLKFSPGFDAAATLELSMREGCRIAFSPCDSTYAAKPLRFRWTSRTAGIAEVEVEAGKDGRQDTLIVDFSKVTDLSGNAAEGSNGGTALIRHVPF